MKIETVQTEELSHLDKFINEVIEQIKVVDIRLTTTVFQENFVYCFSYA